MPQPLATAPPRSSILSIQRVAAAPRTGSATQQPQNRRMPYTQPIASAGPVSNPSRVVGQRDRLEPVTPPFPLTGMVNQTPQPAPEPMDFGGRVPDGARHSSLVTVSCGTRVQVIGVAYRPTPSVTPSPSRPRHTDTSQTATVLGFSPDEDTVLAAAYEKLRTEWMAYRLALVEGAVGQHRASFRYPPGQPRPQALASAESSIREAASLPLAGLLDYVPYAQRLAAPGTLAALRVPLLEMLRTHEQAFSRAWAAEAPSPPEAMHQAAAADKAIQNFLEQRPDMAFREMVAQPTLRVLFEHLQGSHVTGSEQKKNPAA